MKKKIIRTATVPESLNILLKGQLKFLSNHFEVIGVSSQGKQLDELVQREGVIVLPVEMKRKIAPLQDLLSLFKLYFLFLKEKPVLVHSITPKAGLLTMLAAKLAGVPVRVHTFTGLIFPYRQGVLQKILILMDKILCSCATNVFPEGQGVKGDLIKFKITSKPLDIIENGNVNGVDLKYFDKSNLNTNDLEQLKKELGINPDDFVFIFVGRLVKEKGIEELVNAFDDLCTHHTKKIKLLLVGALEENLDPLSSLIIEKMRKNSQIIEVGFQNDVRPYFGIANCLVFPSYREGFPNVVLQAGAMELPSIVTNISGCNEIITNNKNGIIVEPKDVNELKSAMIDILRDKDTYQILKMNARATIANKYNQERIWNAILKEYNRLIELNNV